jgi:hypothetical protein
MNPCSRAFTSNCFKDTLDGLSVYLLSKRPPKAAALMEAALKEASANIGCDSVNEMNDCLIEGCNQSRLFFGFHRIHKRYSGCLVGMWTPIPKELFISIVRIRTETAKHFD